MVEKIEQMRIGELLTKAKLISEEDLENRLDLAKTIGQPIGQILVQSGDLTKYQLICAVQMQSLVLDAALTPEQATDAIGVLCQESLDLSEALQRVGFVQKNEWNCRLGELLVSASLLTERRLMNALSSSFDSCMPLGQTLVRTRSLRPDIIAAALALQRKTRIGKITREQALKELKAIAAANPEWITTGGMQANDSPTTFSERVNTWLWQQIRNVRFNGRSDSASNGSPEDLIGTIVADRYEITGFIGGGGMSFVYLVKHKLLDKVLALKVMQPNHHRDDDLVRRFQVEARAVSAIDHPNVVSVHDFGVAADGTTFLVMDYLEGRSLAEQIKADERIAPERALPMFTQACSALHYAHGKGIIHRDLKPSNIMLVTWDNSPDFVKIVDFGIAKFVPQGGIEHHRITKSGELLGSPLYMSPEHCLGKELDARSDIYAMGCVMYETLMGHPPYVGATVYEIFQKQMNEFPEMLSGVIRNQTLCSEIEAVIFTCLAKDPPQRYQSMTQLREALDKIIRTHVNPGISKL